MKKWLFYFLVFIGCKKIDISGYQLFTIKKGKHISGYRYNSDYNNNIKFKAIFDSSAIYKTVNSTNQSDVNKLYGVSDCNKNHMEYSIRFGWRYYNNKLEILWFKHESGDFTFGVIKEIEINKSYTYTLNVCSIIPRKCNNEYKRYYLYPYFGGDETAPHNITIKIKKYEN